MLLGNFPSIGSVALQPEYRSSGGFFKNTELNLLKGSRETIRNEAVFFEELSKYSLTALKHVQYRFNAVSEKGNSMIGLVVGFIGKTGIIPAVALIILAIFNVGEKTGFSALGYLAFSAVVMYLLMFRLMLVVIQYKSYSNILNFHLENYRK